MIPLLDLFIKTATNINLIFFIIAFYYMKPLSFIYSMFIFTLFNHNIFYIFMMVLMYLMEYILKRYINYNLMFRISIITFYYVVLFDIDISYIINILLVIIIHLSKYNNNGDNIGIKELSK